MATCRDCKNYKDCNENQKIKIEVFLGEPIAKPCNYVKQICHRYTPKESCENCVYYDTDRQDQPCCGCVNGLNFESEVSE